MKKAGLPSEKLKKETFPNKKRNFRSKKETNFLANRCPAFGRPERLADSSKCTFY